MGEDKHQSNKESKYSEKVVIRIPRNDINLLPSLAQCTQLAVLLTFKLNYFE